MIRISIVPKLFFPATPLANVLVILDRADYPAQLFRCVDIPIPFMQRHLYVYRQRKKIQARTAAGIEQILQIFVPHRSHLKG